MRVLLILFFTFQANAYAKISLSIGYNKNIKYLAEAVALLKSDPSYPGLGVNFIERDYDFELLSENENNVFKAAIIPSVLYQFLERPKKEYSRKMILSQIGASDVVLIKPRGSIDKLRWIYTTVNSGEFNVFCHYLRINELSSLKEKIKDSSLLELMKKLKDGNEFKDNGFVVNKSLLENINLAEDLEIRSVGRVPLILIVHQELVGSHKTEAYQAIEELKKRMSLENQRDVIVKFGLNNLDTILSSLPTDIDLRKSLLNE